MEEKIINPTGRLIRIVLTGSECTGKSTLAADLALHYNTVYVPEYARSYVEGLKRPYCYNDVVHIAETQVKEVEEYSRYANRFLFLDTYLIITKIWFKVVFGHYPQWIDLELLNEKIDLYLLCNNDIQWIKDPVRENGGEMREKLHKMYLDELTVNGLNYEVINGRGPQRLQNAIHAVDLYLMSHKNKLL
jgi:NadR type nicotinamide-nucleotide adenylyltransferase